MPAAPVPHSPTFARQACRGLFALGLALLAAASAAWAQPAAEPVKTKSPLGVRLPDGTYLWPGSPDGGERVEVSAEEWRKMLDQLDQLKKQVAVRKPLPPSECRLRAKVEKRGELSVVAVKATYEFRTSQPRSVVALGGRRAFPVAAVLDGSLLPVLDAVDDGLAALIDTVGPHTLTLDLEMPVTARGIKGEVGFELGLPRAAITKLVLDPVPGNVKRLNVTTRMPDAADPAKPAAAVRESGLDAKALADGGKALGAIDSLEVTWEPPASAAPAVDAVRAADWDVAFHFSEAFLDTTAKLRLQGSAREWRFVAPAGATVSVERAPTAGSPAPGPEVPPAVTKPDANKPIWKVDFGAGSAADWVVTIEARQPRPKVPEAKHRGPFPVGPFAALDVFRQTGTVKIQAGPNMRFVFKNASNLRQIEPPVPGEEHATAAFFRLATGPIPASFQPAQLLDVEARPLTGKLLIRPTYRLKLTESGWRVFLDVRVTPVRSEVDQVMLELPAGWPTPESAAAIVDTIQLQKTENSRAPLAVRLVAGHREPFDFTLTATLPVADAARGNTTLLLPRFPQAPEGDTQVTIEVPGGKELRASAYEWDGDQPSTWANPLAPVPGPDGKPTKPVAAVAGKFDQGLARVDVAWQPHRPELNAEVRADVDVYDKQVVVEGEVRLHSPDGFPKALRFNGPAGAIPVRKPFPFADRGLGEWDAAVPPPEPGKDPTNVVLKFAYVVPLPPRPPGADERTPRRIPVGLFWPAAATRADATVRVWPTAAGPQTLTVATEGWRDLPPAPSADRSSLPALTLFGGGPDLALALDVRPAGEAALSIGQVDRALVEVSGRERGPLMDRRGMFLIRRWFAPVVEVELPGLLRDSEWRAFVKGKQSTGAHLGGEPNVLRIPLPADADRGGPFAVEVRYQTPGVRASWDAVTFAPPRIRAASYAGPTRWLIALPSGATPLLFDETCQVEQRWRISGGLPQPGAAGTSADLVRWFQAGTEADSAGTADDAPAGSGEVLMFQQDAPSAVSVLRVPRVGLIAASSLLAFTAGILLTRLSAAAAGVIVLSLAGGIAAAAVVVPQPAAQIAAAAQPGILAVALVLTGQAALRWYQHHRVTYLPGFTRTRIDPSTGSALLPPPAAQPSARNGASKGSTGTATSAHPPADAGAASNR